MQYTKMHGAGNSFVLIENRNGELGGIDPAELARLLCGKEKGPGADGLIIVTDAGKEADFGMLFYNADGTRGEMCGNGARCLARYGVEHGLAEDAENIRILATAGLVRARRITEEQYEVRLNDPSVIDLHRKAFAAGKEYDCAYIELGNPGIPHAVVEVSPAELEKKEDLRERGRMLRHSEAFPRGANVTFACIMGEHAIRAITFERGVEDFTLACGTGCGATAVSLILRGKILGNRVEIDMPGGHLSVSICIAGESVHDVLLTGPTAVVARGETALPGRQANKEL